ncbi:Uncharacterised protein [Vibrio cholerae]|nr:Uncharacterised protein [Vibrio cholerae]
MSCSLNSLCSFFDTGSDDAVKVNLDIVSPPCFRIQIRNERLGFS